LQDGSKGDRLGPQSQRTDFSEVSPSDSGERSGIKDDPDASNAHDYVSSLFIDTQLSDAAESNVTGGTTSSPNEEQSPSSETIDRKDRDGDSGQQDEVEDKGTQESVSQSRQSEEESVVRSDACDVSGRFCSRS